MRKLDQTVVMIVDDYIHAGAISKEIAPMLKTIKNIYRLCQFDSRRVPSTLAMERGTIYTRAIFKNLWRSSKELGLLFYGD